MNKKIVIDKKDIEDNRFVAALSYLWILWVVPMFFKRDSQYAQWHAKQGLMLFLVELVIWFFFIIPVFGWMIWLGVVALSIWGAKEALDGNVWEMPVLGRYAQKLKL